LITSGVVTHTPAGRSGARVIYQTRCHPRPTDLSLSLSLSLSRCSFPRLYINDISVIFASRLVLPVRLADEDRSTKHDTRLAESDTWTERDRASEREREREREGGGERTEDPSSKHHHSTSVRLARTSCSEFVYPRDTDDRSMMCRKTEEMEIPYVNVLVSRLSRIPVTPYSSEYGLHDASFFETSDSDLPKMESDRARSVPPRERYSLTRSRYD